MVSQASGGRHDRTTTSRDGRKLAGRVDFAASEKNSVRQAATAAWDPDIPRNCAPREPG